jgi:NAD(P)-dependent dehydrogenase (short-subunit alcohol dehydrogenase family)
MRLLITGSTGIAAATAAMARGRSAQVVTVGIDASADIVADLREETAAAKAFTQALVRLQGLDALFNVAGASGRRHGDGPWHECSLDGYRATFDSNCTPGFLMTRLALRHWLEIKSPGAVLNMGSVSAEHPEPQHFAAHAYAGAKGALHLMTRAAAAYYAPHGIRLNVIAPGLVRTPMSQRAQGDPAIMEFIERKQPLGGILTADEIAEAALFLLGDSGRKITGQTLVVDGGWSIA